ncbi:hypothetical protein [Zobellia laminariae]|uniref:hypothetical protein n=1 Tax=Zobellia laminariae TaxID=248906 RepID=UPI0026F458FB|nr:hypothetical protein [Zobellia laminariae]WKX76686.1 hypothetical protein Q5W13_00455 [Zobellia laminariae]
MRNIILIILFAFNLNFSQGQDTIKPDTLKQVELVQTLQNETLPELDYYKMLYNSQVESNDTFETLFQWTIGLSFGFLIAIIGSQIFFNYRINKKEIEYIKKDLQESILELEGRQNKNMTTKFSELEKELKIVIEKNSNTANEKLEEKLKSSEKIQSIELKILENTIDRGLKDLSQRTEKELKVLEKDLSKNTGDLWKLKGIESNALTSFIKSALLQKDLNYEVKYILDDIIQILHPMDEIFESDYENLKKLYELVKTSHKSKAEKLNDAIKNKGIYTFDMSKPDWNVGMFGFGPTKKIIRVKKNEK